MAYYWPALIMGVVMTAYWGRVMRLVWKMRKTTGRAANFRPAERLGQWLRIIWYPAAVVWVVYPYVAFASRKLPVWASPLYRCDICAWLAAAVAVAALIATWICWRKMGKSWRMGIDPGEKTQLIVSGPYAYVRHPIYALSSLLMLATLVIVSSPLMLVAGLSHLLLLQWEARREEKYLTVHHGQAYADYCRKVGRFIPRSLSGYNGAAEAQRA